ncbi:MAG: hydantoinase/oxoprolinase family protein [Alphaproteobacteria bacterium]|nr:hydantoinase/oxoprolinase family protein [Alphaproteobacteria bacterium]
MSSSSVHLGVDVGGTFTDMVVFDDRGQLHCFKMPSTPARPAEATLTGLDEIVSALGLTPAHLAGLQHTHGSTIAVNALIERRGARLGMITTDGFRDVFELGRLAIPHPMRYDSRRLVPLIPRGMIRGVPGRLDASGRERVPLDEAALAKAAKELAADGAALLLVSFLHSYRNPAHERRAREVIKAILPDMPVELSCEVWPQAREYERAVTAAVNAYVRPPVERYLEDLVGGTAARGIGTEPRVTRSNGGMQRARTILRQPVSALLSGPAAGVAAAAAVARDCGWDDADLITIDVGGTSADVGCVRHGQPVLSTEEHIAEFPLLLPSIAVSSVGAGGGSIVWVDETGALKVGPRSAGADPGPACYGKGSTTPSLTDAMLVAGWLDDGQRLGGRIPLRLSEARKALSPLAKSMGLDVEAIADGAISIAIAIMAAETSHVLARRGIDAPEFSLVPFGGAGPLIGALLAEEVYVDRVLVPQTPGALSALGAAYSDVQGDLIAPTYRLLSELASSELGDTCRQLEDDARRWLGEEAAALPMGEVRITFSADMRYEGQGYDVTVPVPRDVLLRNDTAALAGLFAETYRAIYGHTNDRADLWVKEIRARAVGVMPRPRQLRAGRSSGSAVKGSRRVRIAGKLHTASTLDRASLGAGDRVAGPAIIDQLDTTLLVPPRWQAEVMESGSILMTHS